ncbi:hypothetical protein ACE41H_24925 [Paenibacillus enshidis]|uniref:Uncharacterized protein n=1 Tax=Paenibacillus enshidis TaxID=1458439 RepID=A0ABV5B1G4_9BACL
MDATWSYWLDAVDGDHLIVGSRADEILDRELYDDPFDNGSLSYPSFIASKETTNSIIWKIGTISAL